MKTRTAVLAVVLLVAPIVAALLLRGPHTGWLVVTSPGAKAADPNDAWSWEDWVTAEGFITVATEKGLPALHAAAGRGDLAGVTRLLAQGGDANARDKDGWTPLHWAAYEGQTRVMEALLAHRGDPSATAYRDTYYLAPDMLPRATPEQWRSIHKRQNATPLRAALAKGREGAARLLLARLRPAEKERVALVLWAAQYGYGGGIDLLAEAGTPVDTPDKDGWTPLHWAARNQHAAAVAALLAHGAKANARTRSKAFAGQMLYQSPVGQTPLHLAGGHAETLRLLLAHGADANARDADGRTPLHVASYDVEAVKLLLAHGADANARDRSGKTPLVESLQYLDTGARDALLAHGVDVNAADNEGRTPLFGAQEDSRVDITAVLLEHGAKASARDHHGQTPLHYLAGHSWDSTGKSKAEQLLAHGADPAAKDAAGETPLAVAVRTGADHDLTEFLRQRTSSSGKPDPRQTPLHEAAARGDAARVSALLSEKAARNAQNGEGKTPLYCAVAGKHVKVAALLLARGANPDLADTQGWTPLHRAAYDGDTDLVGVLLSHGAKTAAKAKDGDAPLHLAVSRGNIDVVRLLLERGADPNAIGRGKSTPLERAFAIETETEYTGPKTDDMLDLLKQHGARDR
jgi:ankyrin repeat protein